MELGDLFFYCASLRKTNRDIERFEGDMRVEKTRDVVYNFYLLKLITIIMVSPLSIKLNNNNRTIAFIAGEN